MRVSVGDVRLYFEVFGQEYAIPCDGASLVRRPVVIALHGGPGIDGAKLRFQLAQLADAAQVVVPDQRGHGRSDVGAPQTWNLDQWAADVEAFADVLGIERPVVLGESFGGFVAQRYASAYPDRPAAMILVSCGPRFVRHEEIAAQAASAGGADLASVITRRGGAGEEAEAEEEWARVVEPLLSVRPDPVLDRVEQLRIRTMEVNRHFEAEGSRLDLRPGLAHVRCPTLVIVGERDVLVPARLGQEIVEALPPGLGRLEVVRDASHNVLTDNPTESRRLISEFVAQAA